MFSMNNMISTSCHIQKNQKGACDCSTTKVRPPPENLHRKPEKKHTSSISGGFSFEGKCPDCNKDVSGESVNHYTPVTPVINYGKLTLKWKFSFFVVNAITMAEFPCLFVYRRVASLGLISPTIYMVSIHGSFLSSSQPLDTSSSCFTAETTWSMLMFFCSNKHVWNRESLWTSKQPEMLLTHWTWRWWTNKFKNGFLKYESLDPTWRARQIKGVGLRNSIVKTIGPLAGNTNKGTNCIKGPGCASLKAFHVPRKLAERHALSETNSKHPWKQVIKQKGITSSTYWFSGAMLVSGIVTKVCQFKIFHQPKFPSNKGISLSQLLLGVRLCEAAIIWQGDCILYLGPCTTHGEHIGSGHKRHKTPSQFEIAQWRASHKIPISIFIT